MRIAILGVICAAAGASLLVPTASAATAPAKPTKANSPNWAGYYSHLASDVMDFNRVSASWVEPRVTCPAPNAGIAFGVGLSGTGGGTATLQFAGSSMTCYNGVPSYNAEYVMQPAPFSFPEFTVAPGDHMTATVSYIAPNFVLSVTDTTSKQAFTVNALCPSGSNCLRNSAEVATILEGDSVHANLPQARYGKITFTGISMHDAHGHTGTFTNRNWLTTEYTMVTGHTLATSSALGNSGASFTDTWVAAQ
jgi:Peptidase A4 family